MLQQSCCFGNGDVCLFGRRPILQFLHDNEQTAIARAVLLLWLKMQATLSKQQLQCTSSFQFKCLYVSYINSLEEHITPVQISLYCFVSVEGLILKSCYLSIKGLSVHLGQVYSVPRVTAQQGKPSSSLYVHHLQTKLHEHLRSPKTVISFKSGLIT